MNTTLVILIILFIILLPATLYLYRYIPSSERRRMMINLGFSEAGFIESYILNKIRRILKTKVKKKNIFRYSSEGAQFLIIFSNTPSYFNRQNFYSISVISEKLQLPRLTLKSKLHITDRLDIMMSSTMDQLAESEIRDKNLHKIEIASYPELNQHFVVLGENKDTLKDFFTIEKSRKLTQIKDDIKLSANQDLFMLNVNVSQNTESSDENIMRKAINLSRKIFHILMTNPDNLLREENDI